MQAIVSKVGKHQAVIARAHGLSESARQTKRTTRDQLATARADEQACGPGITTETRTDPMPDWRRQPTAGETYKVP